jgi:hypothetical protein
MKHCTGRQLECAKAIIPELLKTYPYNTRFLDVTPAEGPIECFSTAHPTTRATDIANRQALCRYVSEELGLVTGGEHGRYWSAPFLHYHEGMMGGGFYSWPAGYLMDPKDRSEISQEYLDYGINPANRAPLFELVFHDCVVNYWYWGACNDYLHQVMPELTDRMTAMNILYGTPPMMWAHNHGLRWQVPEERELMLTIYRNVCKLHEVIGMQEMVSHAFLTPDRLVQQTEFADGTTCTVNFGKTPFDLPWTAPEGEPCTLAENDFQVSGPAVEQWRHTAADGTRQTLIRTGTFLLAETGPRPLVAPGVRVTGQASVTTETPNRARILLARGASLDLDVAAWRPSWKRASCVLLALDGTGQPSARVTEGAAQHLALRAPADGSAAYLLLAGPEAEVPDVTITRLALTRADGTPVTSETPLAPEDTVAIACGVRNHGLAAAKAFDLVLQLDGPGGPELVRQRIRRLAAGDARATTAVLPASRADGARQVLARIVAGTTIALTGRTEATAAFTGPCAPGAFLALASFAIEPPGGDSAGLAVEVPVALRCADGTVADSANLRVRFANGAVVPAQFEPAVPGAVEGIVVFCLPSGLRPHMATAATLLGVPTGDRQVLPHASRFDVAPDGSRLRLGTYSASVAQGNPTDIAIRAADGSDLAVAERIIVSAKETGWNQEHGAVEAFACLHRGPVRAVFTATKKLASGHRIDRTCLFYADRMEIRTTCEPGLATLTRAFFLRDATAANQTGRSTAMDGKGDGEGFGFQGTPAWYAVFSPEYRCACIALTPTHGFVYWDSGSRGQISLDSEPGSVERRLFLWGPGAGDDGFAKAAAQAYAEGVKVSPLAGR